MNVLTFGEIMLRLRAPGHERFFQSSSMEATFGGGEANVAVSLANYGMDTEFFTVLPDNAIGDACVQELRRFGVGTKKIQRGEGRMQTSFPAGWSMTGPVQPLHWQGLGMWTGRGSSRVWTGST